MPKNQDRTPVLQFRCISLKLTSYPHLVRACKINVALIPINDYILGAIGQYAYFIILLSAIQPRPVCHWGLAKVVPIERSCCMCNVFSHWLIHWKVIDGLRVPKYIIPVSRTLTAQMQENIIHGNHCLKDAQHDINITDMSKRASYSRLMDIFFTFTGWWQQNNQVTTTAGPINPNMWGLFY